MIPPTYARIDERPPFAVKRRMRKRPEPSEEPAITILPPEPFAPADYFRSSSPGVYKTAPTKAATSKGPSSFVILGEMLNTPVQSRPSSPSGRVSPFRGKGFKSPAASRATSRTTSRAASPIPKKGTPPTKKPVPPTKPKFKTDIGLPPKSPKKVKPRPVKSNVVQKTNLGVDTKTKPSRTPRPGRKPLTVAKKTEKPPEPVEEMVLVETPKPTDMDEVSEALSNLERESVREVKGDVPDGGESERKAEDAEVPKEETTAEGAAPLEKGEKKESEIASVIEEGEKSNRNLGEKITEGGGSEKKGESDKLIPCFQPDKCHIAPPTMASPSPIIASAINAPSTTSGSAFTKTTESIDTAQASTVTTTSLNALSSAVTISGNLARKSRESGLASSVIEPKSAAKEEEKTQPPPQSDRSGKLPSSDSAENSTAMPPHSQLSVPAGQTNKASSDSVPGDIITTSNLIKVDSELELLSANSLRDSPPRRQPNSAWSEERLVNGDVPSPADNRSKFRRFLSSVWSLIKYILCCRCIIDRCRRAACCKCNSKCCRGDDSKRPGTNCCSCLGRLNVFKRCCGRSNCCKCRKPKCCDGLRCCRGKSKVPREKRKCCAKMNCKDCCSSVRNCCSDCGGKVNKLCRALFCLNLMCCQRCLKKCCKPCHKLTCCQAGGCCSCFNPGVKRPPKLDKRASTQSKSGKQGLDPVLVEHVSLMKAAIPVLPTCLAILCLVLNLIFPGSGTLMSGLFCLCFGKPRFSVTDSAKNRVGSFCVNLVIGIAQLFTIVFCLVGWGWSIWWGVIMYRLARKQRRIRLAEKSTQEANSSANQNHVDVEKG